MKGCIDNNIYCDNPSDKKMVQQQDVDYYEDC